MNPGRLQRGVTLLKHAVFADPADSTARQALAAVYEHSGSEMAAACRTQVR